MKNIKINIKCMMQLIKKLKKQVIWDLFGL